MQVSSDSNLLLFSDYDNLAALNFAQAQAHDLNRKLVVKPHPAEPNPRLLDEIEALCTQRGHLWTGYYTSYLVSNADRVITINSTVGLEAILLDKPVVILGRSLYQNFSKSRAFAFLLRYLIDVRPHDSDPASQSAIDRILCVIDRERA
jgi:capsular polysaccharide export protein